MSIICTTCPSGALPAALDVCDLTTNKNTGEFLVFMRCDYQFSDITDPVDWAAAIFAGDVVVSPPGFFSKALPAQTSTDVACNVTVQTQQGQEIVYRTGLVLSDLSDQAFWKTLRDNPQHYRVMGLLCDGQFMLEESYLSVITVANVSPGFVFSWIVPPDYVVAEGNDQLIQWNATLLLRTPGIICRRFLPGIPDVLKA